MNGTTLARQGLFFLLVSATLNAGAGVLTNPVTDPNFTTLPGGKTFSQIIVSGSKLTLSRGTGTTFSSTARANYTKWKTASKADPNYKLQWQFVDLDNHQIIDQSANPNRKFFGASSSKIFVGGTLLNQQTGALQPYQLQLMSEMLSVSSNTAWVALQKIIGGGNDDLGRQRNLAFTQGLGYANTRGFQGSWGSMHGNELTAADTAQYLYDTYHGIYPGAETLWKLMHACRTGATRGRKYIPASIYVGAKTGTYDGPSIDPETGKSKTATGRTFTVAVRNHVLVFNIGGHEYGLVIMADTGSDESAAVMAGGLIREYAGIQ